MSDEMVGMESDHEFHMKGFQFLFERMGSNQRVVSASVFFFFFNLNLS